MAYDIYGNNLMPGHCEVHPTVHESYPCSLCVAQQQQSQQQPEYDKVGELEHYLGQAQNEIDRLTALLDAEMESNKGLCERELALSTRVEKLEGVLKIALDEWKAWMDDADNGDFSSSNNDDREAWNQALAATKQEGEG